MPSLTSWPSPSKSIGPANGWGPKSILHLCFWFVLLRRDIVAEPTTKETTTVHHVEAKCKKDKTCSTSNVSTAVHKHTDEMNDFLNKMTDAVTKSALAAMLVTTDTCFHKMQ